MEAKAYELKTILGNDRRFLVPTFQRDYEWTESDQWSLLFDDLVSTAARLSSARAQAKATGDTAGLGEKRVAPHFLGAIVLDGLPAKAGAIAQHAVIDGQQRLTTLLLMLRGLLDVLVEVQAPSVSRVRRHLFNPVDDPAVDPQSTYKLWPRRKDREVWCAAMSDDTRAVPANHPYGKARRYFAERVRGAADLPQKAAIRGPGSDAEAALGSAATVERLGLDVFVDAALGLFKIVSIDLDENDDAQVIFEVLNGRQTGLSAADLVKNLLFLRAEIADERELEDLHERYWAPLETQWWKKEIGRGHAARQQRELLLAAWLSAQKANEGEEINVGHLYGEIRTYLGQTPRKVDDVLAQIASYREAYRRVIEPEDSRDGRRTADGHRRINRLGITTAYPLLLWLKTLAASVCSPDQELRAVVAVESWAMRRLLTRRNTRGYGKIFLKALAAAQNATQEAETTGEALVPAIVEQLAASDWPTDAEVLAAFESFPFYKQSAERVRLVLGAIDAALVAERPKSEPYVINYDDLQIEHVMPKAWRNHWPLSASDPASEELAAAARDQAIHTIGNLTLLTAALNPALSNGPWEDKQPEIARHGRLHVNTEFFLDPGPWDEATIRRRGRTLAEIAIRIWPSPTAI